MPSKATATSEVRVNTDITTQKEIPDIAVLDEGGWIVTWLALGLQGDDSYDVYQQRYDASGGKVGGETLVNTSTENFQYNGRTTGLADGGWLTTWYTQYGEIEVPMSQQRYDASGTRVGGETPINIGVHQRGQSAIGMEDGGWLVTWYSYDGDEKEDNVYYRRFNAQGEAMGAETQINTTIEYDQYDPSMTLLADGGWLVAWTGQQSEVEPNSEDIFQQRYDASGTAVGGEIRVNTTLGGSQGSAKVAALTGGGWVATWVDYRNYENSGSGSDIFQQRFDTTGIAVGGEVRVNTYAEGNQRSQSVTGLADGGWVVTWNDSSGHDGDGVGLYQQRYDAKGKAVGGEAQVSDATEGGQGWSSVKAFDDGSWVVTWQSNHDSDSSIYSIYQRRFAADIEGGKSADKLVGTVWDERITGFAGKDRLISGEGQDVLVGGVGADRFIFKVGDTAATRQAADTIDDFSRKQHDVIDLKAIDADVTRAGNNMLDFIGTQRFHKEAGELRLEKKGGDSWVMGDTDGDGRADFTIHIDGAVNLAASDFTL